MVLGAPLQLNTVFGYSPTVGGRFAGMGNLAYGQFAGAAFILCGLLSRRLAGRSVATVVAFGVLLLAIVIDGMPIWGADVGGVLAFVPAVGVTAAKLLGHRIRWRSVLVWGGAALAAVAVFAAIDLSRPADSRTHLGRLVESVGDKGFGALETVVTRKLGANLGVITSSVWTAMVPIAFGFIVYLLWRAPGHVARHPRHDPGEPRRAGRRGSARLRPERLGDRGARRHARRRQRLARVPHGSLPAHGRGGPCGGGGGMSARKLVCGAIAAVVLATVLGAFAPRSHRTTRRP